MNSTPTPDRIIDVAYGYRGAKALLTAVELGLFTRLAGTALEAEALRQQLGLAPRGALDFFDALVALGLIDRDPVGRYTNTPEAALYLDRNRQDYVGGLLENLNAREYVLWSSLTDALRAGKPQTGFSAERHFNALYSEPDRLRTFAKGMTGASIKPAQAIAAKFPWHEYRTLMDVGAAEGCLPVQISRAHEHVTAGGMDLPQMQALFEEYVDSQGLDERVSFHPGDFFQDPLPSADVLVMGRVLHNWDLSGKRMLLEKAYTALSAGGALIVYERLIDEERRSPAGLLSSLNMLIMTAGGFDFTASECVVWMRDAGFRAMRREPLDATHTMIVGYK